MKANISMFNRSLIQHRVSLESDAALHPFRFDDLQGSPKFSTVPRLATRPLPQRGNSERMHLGKEDNSKRTASSSEIFLMFFVSARSSFQTQRAGLHFKGSFCSWAHTEQLKASASTVFPTGWIYKARHK